MNQQVAIIDYEERVRAIENGLEVTSLTVYYDHDQRRMCAVGNNTGELSWEFTSEAAEALLGYGSIKHVEILHGAGSMIDDLKDVVAAAQEIGKLPEDGHRDFYQLLSPKCF